MREAILAMTAGVALGIAGVSVPAAADTASTEEIAKINELLTGMQCEVDADDIEKEGDRFELDDVFCADGQYDIVLDANFEVLEKKAE